MVLVKRHTAYIYHGRIALSEGWQNGNIGNKRLKSQPEKINESKNSFSEKIKLTKL